MKIYLYIFILELSLLNPRVLAQTQKTTLSCVKNFHNYTAKPIIDLNIELNTFQSLSGGEIIITQNLHQPLLIQRNHCTTRYKNNETRSRYQNWLIFKQLHLATKLGEVFSNSLPVSKKLKSFLYRFAMSPAGALWIQKIVNFDLYLIQKKYYKISTHGGNLLIMPTEEFLFDLAYSKFYIAETNSSTYASGSFIAINKNFLDGRYFSKSQQKIDHMAILSHELGHTKFGDQNTRGDIYSEASAVARYENPVRILNHFTPRKTYYYPSTGQTINVYTKKIIKTK